MRSNIARISLGILVIGTLLTVQGCTKIVNPYDDEFNCKANPKGGKCVNTPTAYRDARYGASTEDSGASSNCIDGNCGNAGNSQGEGDQSAGTSPAKAQAQDIRYRALTDMLSSPKAPVLTPPTILRVLMMPYKGETGELYMTRFAYVEVTPADWSLTDIHE